MRNEVIAITMVFVVVLAFLAGLVSSTLLLQRNGTSTTSSSSVPTLCTVAAEGQLILQVLNSTNGKPVAFAPVYGQFISGCSYIPINLNGTSTNATGFVTFGGEVGEYHLNLHTLGNYFVYASTNPGETTCVTLSIPSRETHITYGGLLLPDGC